MCAAGLALAMGCGSSGGDDQADAGDTSCSNPPDPPTLLGECESWECSPREFPECWSCSTEPISEGEECEGESPSVCIEGTCTPVTDPGAAGSLTWTTSTHDLTVGSDTIPLTIYLPDGDGPFPVVLFTHGFMLDPSLYASYGEHLASWGYLTVMPGLPGNLLSSPSHRELKEILIAVIDWIDSEADNESGPLQGKAAAGRLGLAGHSMGGKISLLVATEDRRPLAVYGLDPVDSTSPLSSDPVEYPSVTPELMSEIEVPLVLTGETVNSTASGIGGQACAPADQNFHQYYLHAESPALEIEFVGAFHMSFLDNPDCGLTCSACPSGTDDPATTRRLSRRYLTAFFNVVLSDEPGYAIYLTGSSMAADEDSGLVISEAKNGF